MNLGWGCCGDGSKEAPTPIPVCFQAKPALIVSNGKNPPSSRSEFFTQQVGREHTERWKGRDLSSLAISKTNVQRETTDPGTSETGVRTRESKKMGRQQVGAPGSLPREAAGHGSLLCTIWGMVCGKSDLKCQGHKGQKRQCRCTTKDARSRQAREPGQRHAPDFSSPHLSPPWIPSVITCPRNSVLQTLIQHHLPLPSPPHQDLTNTYTGARKTSLSACPRPSVTWLQNLPRLVRFSLYLLSAWSRQLINTVD